MSAEQGSIAWLIERVGHCTASRFGDVIGKGAKGQYLAPRDAYKWELVIERLTGTPSDHWTSAAMLWGQETEQQARMAYEAHSGAMVEEIGFVAPQEFVGGSADGLVDDDGLIECKCPFNSKNHLQTVLTGMPEEHIAQTQGLMWILDRQWCDFVSYDPRMPDPLKLYVQRIPRDDDFIATLQAEVKIFLQDVAALVDKLQPRIIHESQSAADARFAAMDAEQRAKQAGSMVGGAEAV